MVKLISVLYQYVFLYHSVSIHMETPFKQPPPLQFGPSIWSLYTFLTPCLYRKCHPPRANSPFSYLRSLRNRPRENEKLVAARLFYTRQVKFNSNYEIL